MLINDKIANLSKNKELRMESEPLINQQITFNQLLINKVAALPHWPLKVIDTPLSPFFKDAVVQSFVFGNQSVQNLFCFSQINSFKPVHLSDILGGFCQRFVD